MRRKEKGHAGKAREKLAKQGEKAIHLPVMGPLHAAWSLDLSDGYSEGGTERVYHVR